ncbi:MAG TPA: IscS subfamily cysteine desulfurase, partial [Methylomirabilota bacterium]|nr:IscS subfamily cysteine desulfurase [Methylomirabilota bacterium]
RLRVMRDRLLKGLMAEVPDVVVNGDLEQRLPGNINVGFPHVSGQALLAEVPELSLSLGSACTSAAIEPSYVLRALGLPDELANGSIRIGLGRFTSVTEIDFAVDRLGAAVRRLRAAAPQRTGAPAA